MKTFLRFWSKVDYTVIMIFIIFKGVIFMAAGVAGNSTVSYDSTSLGYLKTLSDVTVKLNLKKVAEYLKQYEDPFDKLSSDINPIFKIIGVYYKTTGKKTSLNEWATAITGTIELMDSTSNIIIDLDNGNKTATDISQDIGNIVSKITTVSASIAKLATGEKPYFAGMLAAVIGLTANVIGSIDGLEIDLKEYKEIAKSGVQTLSAVINAMVGDLVEDTTKKESLTAPLGPIALGTSALTGLISGVFQFQSQIQKYTDDGIPESIAIKDSIIDGVVSFLHDTASSFTKGVDDVAFNALRFVTSFAVWGENQLAALITGNETEKFNYTATDKNYVEWIGEVFKTLNVKNSGSTGDDMLISEDNSAMIYGDSGNDYIRNFASNATIWAGHDNDTVFSHENTHNNSILGGPGIDVIVGFDTNSTFYGGTENDRIAIYGNSNKILGEDGNDAILLSGGSNNIVNGGLGNDIIILESASNSVIEYSEGNGNDIIYGFEENDRINIAGNYSTSTSGQNVLLLVGTETITLDSAKGLIINVNGKKIDTADTVSSGEPIRPLVSSLVTVPSVWYDNVRTIRGTSIADNINSNISNVLIKALGGNDSVYSTGSNVSVSGGSGNNTINGSGIKYVTTRDGDDQVTIGAGYVNVGGGRNIVSLTSYSYYSDSTPSTVITGDGDDTINIHSSWHSKDYNYNNIILAGGGNNYINNSNRLQATIGAGSGNDTIITGGGSSSINAGAGNNQVSISTSNGNNTIIAGKGNDTIYLNSSSNNNVLAFYGGKDIIYGYNSTDTLNITNSEYSTLSSGNNDIVVQFGTDSITLTGAKGKTINIHTIAGSSSTETSTTRTLTLTNSDKSPVTISSTIKNVDASSRTKAVKIKGNSLANSIVGGSNSDSFSGGAGADTLNGGTGNDTLSGGAGNDVFVYASNSGNDVITDYTSGQDKISITGAKISKTSINGSDVILTVGSGNIKIKNGKGKKLSLYNNSSSLTTTVIGGSSKTVTVNNSTKSPVTVSADITTIDATKRSTAVKITGNTKANTIKGGSGKDTIYGGNGNDSILSNYGNDKLYGDVGNDTLNGGKGNDTLTGGNGKDIFFFASSEGNDVITDYSSAQGDLIRLGTSSMSTSMSGTNVILKVGTGKITVNNAKSQQVSVIGSTGKSTVIGGATTLNVTNSTKSPVTAASTIKVIDASKRTTAVRLTGNSLANTIKGGSAVDTVYGGAGNDSILGNNGNDKLFGDNGNDTLRGGTGNDSVSGGAGADKLYGDNGADTLNGGKGNDTLTGGNGNDVFVYANGDGNDVVADYTAKQDKIKLTSGTINSSSLKGSDVVLKIGSGSITIKNGKNKSITVIDSKGKSSSKVYASSSNNYEEHWFTEDNNFLENEIEFILQNKTMNNSNNVAGQILTFDTNPTSIDKQISSLSSTTYSQNRKMNS